MRTSAHKTLLISMPWSRHYIASIQIAALKSYLLERGIPAEAAHMFLDIAHALGFHDYEGVSREDVLFGEALYSYLMFPEKRSELLRDEEIRGVVARLAASRTDGEISIPLRWEADFFEEFEALHQGILDRYRWTDYVLVGFTLNYGQTISSLYFAQQIKKRHPGVKIIFGGSEASRELGKSLVEHFPFVDYACNGEGEKPLYHLVKALREGESRDTIDRIAGLIGRRSDGEVFLNPPDQLQNLDELPTPDYDEYFRAIEDLGYASPYHVTTTLPAEGSRGCYYACSFCSLNLQWENFRNRSPEAMVKSLRELSNRYQIQDFEFVDNITPKNADAVFDAVAAEPSDYSFFYEMRATLPRRTLGKMVNAGATRVQIGLEALSNAMLDKFNKKSRVIHNLQAMKNCEELGLDYYANLIIDHPLATDEDIQETLKTMQFASAFRPPNAAPSFNLEVGAPEYMRPEGRGFSILGNHDGYRKIFPTDLFERLNLLRKAFSPLGPMSDWSPVKAALENWQKKYDQVTKVVGERRPHLAYYNADTFLKIEDYRSGDLELVFLNETEKEVFLFVDQIKTWSEIRERFADLREDELRGILDVFVELKITYEEKEMYLSLAISSRPHRKALHLNHVRPKHHAELKPAERAASLAPEWREWTGGVS